MTIPQRLKKLNTSALHDVLKEKNYQNFVLPNDITGLNNKDKIAGEVFTVEGVVTNTFSAHETLLQWTRLLSRAPPEKVLVCQPNSASLALMGELSAETLKNKGVLGYVVDGGCRDCEMISRLEFPVFCKFKTPADIVGAWIPRKLGGKIQIGNVDIKNGDYIVGDSDGVIRIPRKIIDEVVTGAEKIISSENKVRKAILSGIDPEEAYIKFGKF